MDQGIKARWIERLRSGEYKQGTGTLNRIEDDDTHSFCCLGVLCEIAVEDGIIRRVDENELSVAYVSVDPEIERVYHDLLPSAVVDWAGLSTDDGAFYVNEDRKSLVFLNDDMRKDFLEIANVIEEKF